MENELISLRERQSELPEPTDVRFDWYRATTTAADHDQLKRVFANLGLVGDVQKPHFKGFERGFSVYDGGNEIGHIAHGGANAPHVLFEVHGPHTMDAVRGFRTACPVHRPTRLDVAIDFDFPDAFEELLADVLITKAKYKLFGERRGDWDDFPELGRTYELGKRQSPGVFVRLYEKGLQKELLHLAKPHWARLEVEIHPDRDNAHLFASLTPIEALAARRFAAFLGGLVLQREIVKLPAVHRQKRTAMQKLEYICRTYKRTLSECQGNLGSWEHLGTVAGRFVTAANESRFHPVLIGGENAVETLSLDPTYGDLEENMESCSAVDL